MPGSVIDRCGTWPVEVADNRSTKRVRACGRQGREHRAREISFQMHFTVDDELVDRMSQVPSTNKILQPDVFISGHDFFKINN